MFHPKLDVSPKIRKMAKMTIMFFPRTEKANKKTGNIPIYLRIIGFREKAEARLSIEVPSNFINCWNSKLMRFSTENQTANQLINKYQQKFDEYVLLNADKLGETNPKSIRDAIMGMDKRKVILAKEYVNTYYTKSILPKDGITAGTKKNYSKSINHFNAFLYLKKIENIPLQKLTQVIGRDFYEYLLSEIPEKKKKKMTEPSAAGYIKKIKAILQRAVFEGHIINNPLEGIKLKTKSPKREKLNSFELKAIYNCNLSNYYNLDRIRDYFMFSALTGLAFSDMMNLTQENLQKWQENKTLLEIKRHKTDVETKQFLTSHAELIIEKYKTEMQPNCVLPKISNQKMNDGLKMIAEKLNLKKKLTSHIARHSYRQLIAEAGIRDYATIKTLMGHSRNNDIDSIYHNVTEKQLLEAKNSIEDYLNQLLN